MKEITNFANYLAVNQDTSFSESILKVNLPTIFQTLVDRGILAPTTPVDSVRCKECDLDHLEQVIEVNHRYFTKCEYSEDASLSEVQLDELNGYRFSLSALLAWIAETLVTQTDIKQLNDATWGIGKKATQNIYFIKSIDQKEAQNEVKKINTENNIFLWLGVNSPVGYSTTELVSIQEVIKISSKGLEVQAIKVKSKKAKPNQKDIVLDKDIVITNNFYLLLNLENGAFNYKVKTLPQTYRIVRYLYDQRKYGKAYTSKELSEALQLDNPKVIPTRIKELNNKCEEHKVKSIVLTYPNNTWALNPDLTCFN